MKSWPEKRNNTELNQEKGDFGQEYEDSGYNQAIDECRPVADDLVNSLEIILNQLINTHPDKKEFKRQLENGDLKNRLEETHALFMTVDQKADALTEYFERELALSRAVILKVLEYIQTRVNNERDFEIKNMCEEYLNKTSEQ